MSIEKNIETVNGIYAAFGRGDAPAIIEQMADDVDWEFGASQHRIPWLVNGRGRAAVKSFFDSLAALDFHEFRPLAVMGEADWVVALVRLECTVKSTGRKLREECEAHIWRFDERGRVAAMRHAADTWHHAWALGML